MCVNGAQVIDEFHVNGAYQERNRISGAAHLFYKKHFDE